MKIRLIHPTQLDERGRPAKFRKLLFPTLTLPTVAALTPVGVAVGITVEHVEDVDFDEKADLVGLTALTCQAPRAYQIAAEFRKRGVPTIMGGIHATACPDEAGQHVDSVLVGEAEGVWPQVIADLDAGRLQRRYEAATKPDLAELHVPRFDLLNYAKYVTPPFARTPLIPIQAMRGCPNRCEFCSVSRYLGHRVRTKPVAHVVREIETIGAREVFFVDDNLVADPAYAMALCQAIKPLRIRWSCQVSAHILRHPELIDAAAAAGCHETFTGIETVRQATLDAMHKRFNCAADYEALFRRLAASGILPQVSLIVGLDDETPEDWRRTIDAITRLPVNHIFGTVLTPLPGTELRERLLREQRVVAEDWSLYDLAHTVIQPKVTVPRKAEDGLWAMYEQFYSLANLARRLWRFRSAFFKYFPRVNVFEEVFFQFHQRRATAQRVYPFAVGPRDSGT